MKDQQKVWEVTLKSKDEHKFIYTLEAPNEQQAKANALERIYELGWEHHLYKLYRITEKGKI